MEHKKKQFQSTHFCMRYDSQAKELHHCICAFQFSHSIEKLFVY